jgi:hypothetical protein
VAARGEVQRGEIDRFLASTTFATSVQWYGSARVAETLAVHGARFLLRHLSDAQHHGHAALAEFIGTQTPLLP